MKALDQAFIKAFSQQDASPAAVARRPDAATSKNGPALDGNRNDEDAPTNEKPAPAAAAPAVAAAMFDRFDGILAALEKMPNLQAENSNRNGTNVAEKAENGAGRLPSNEVNSEFWAIGGAEWAVADETNWPVPKALVPGPEPQPSIPEPPSSSHEPPAPNLEYKPWKPEPRIHNPESRTSSPEHRAPSAKPKHYQPAWQVDRFTWPRVCRRLISRASDEWDRLADSLSALGAQGQKALAVAGCRRGEGATTMLLCAARRLAERGIKTALVDADFSRPRLAERMGVQPQIGWNETSDEEGKSIDRSAVETADGNLALLALREPPEGIGEVAGDWSNWSSCIEQMRRHYEMVLIDLGPLENSVTDLNTPPWATENNIDAVLLVHNRRVTPKEQLDEMQRRLTEAGLGVAGMIENFVAM